MLVAQRQSLDEQMVQLQARMAAKVAEKSREAENVRQSVVFTVVYILLCMVALGVVVTGVFRVGFALP